jgi:hypothetical protein
MPHSVAGIGVAAFHDCKSLRRIRFPANAELEIGTAVCSVCSKLMTVDIPSGIKSIPRGTFVGCNIMVSIKNGTERMLRKSRFAGLRRNTFLD